MAQTNVRELPRNDQLFLGLGVLVLLTSFLPWYGYDLSVSAGGRTLSTSWSETAWTGLVAFGLTLMLVATVLVLVQLVTTATLPEIGVSWNVVVLGLDALGALFVVIKSFTVSHGSVLGASYGLRWGGWILVVVAIAQVVVGALRFRESGEPMPWAASGSAGGSPDTPPAT